MAGFCTLLLKYKGTDLMIPTEADIFIFNILRKSTTREKQNVT